MITSSQVEKYGIVMFADIYSRIDHLFSGGKDFGEDGNETWLDPIEGAHMDAGRMDAQFYDVNVAICPNGTCIVQIVVFRSKEKYELYKADNVILFNHTE